MSFIVEVAKISLKDPWHLIRSVKELKELRYQRFYNLWELSSYPVGDYATFHFNFGEIYQGNILRFGSNTNLRIFKRQFERSDIASARTREKRPLSPSISRMFRAKSWFRNLERCNKIVILVLRADAGLCQSPVSEVRFLTLNKIAGFIKFLYWEKFAGFLAFSAISWAKLIFLNKLTKFKQKNEVHLWH